MGAMYLTADGATQDHAIGELPRLPYPVGPNQYTPVTMLPLSPPNYAVNVSCCTNTSALLLHLAAQSAVLHCVLRVCMCTPIQANNESIAHADVYVWGSKKPC